MRSFILKSLKVLGIIVIAVTTLLTAAALVWLFIIIPNREIPGKTYSFIHCATPELTIEKTTSDGRKYTINNNRATFRCDVVKNDIARGELFANYAAATRRLKENGSPTIPSVQMVLKKCKRADDRICAALELSEQNGSGATPGKRECLTKLLKKLVDVCRAETPSAVVDNAIVHVATALALGRTEPDVPDRLKTLVEKEKARFLADAVRSAPTGLWSKSKDLENLYRQDRYLAGGLKLSDAAPVIVLLSKLIAKDAAARQAFQTFNRLDAAMTNPAVYVNGETRAARPAKCLFFNDVAKFIPPSIDVSDILRETALAEITRNLESKYGRDAGFALVSYATSKEYDLLVNARGGDESSMAFVIDAIRNREIDLTPKPNSGWYDYQWQALETLLMPNMAIEAFKLSLSKAYAKRLEKAFMTALTAMRDTRIKRLPYLCLGGDGPSNGPLAIAPEFSVEPTATVYLRLARSYRFFRDALRAISKNDFPLEPGKTVNEKLDHMTLLCYGLYDMLSPELGIPVQYDENEMSEARRKQAREIAAAWLASTENDTDMAEDVRLAVPIFHAPDGAVRYWSVIGVEIEKVKYAYDNTPEVSSIKKKFTPAYAYLPSAVFLEFELKNQEILTREKFRSLCDKYKNKGDLARALNTEVIHDDNQNALILSILGGLIAAASIFVCARRKKGFNLSAKKIVLVTGTLLSLAVIGGSGIMFFSPYYRTKTLITIECHSHRKFSPRANRFIYGSLAQEKEITRALSEMLSDSNPQIRYQCMLKLYALTFFHSENEILKMAWLEEPLKKSVNDEIVDVAIMATYLLINFKSERNATFLCSQVERSKSIESILSEIIYVIGKWHYPWTIDSIVPLVDDPRPIIRRAALNAISQFDSEKSLDCITKGLRSNDDYFARCSLSALNDFQKRFPKRSANRNFASITYDIAMNRRFSFATRNAATTVLMDPTLRMNAAIDILRSPSVDQKTYCSRYKVETIDMVANIPNHLHKKIAILIETMGNEDKEIRNAARKRVGNTLMDMAIEMAKTENDDEKENLGRQLAWISQQIEMALNNRDERISQTAFELIRQAWPRRMDVEKAENQIQDRAREVELFQENNAGIMTFGLPSWWYKYKPWPRAEK